jgi:hypothetical protein
MDTNPITSHTGFPRCPPQPIVLTLAETKEVARLSLYESHEERHRPPTNPELGMWWTPTRIRSQLTT